MPLTRREAVFLPLPSLSGSQLPGARPNILWLMAEDLSPDLGCYGNRAVRTPNLDRLAREGVRFTQALATGPVCSPSRSAIATGMYQTTIGAHNHRSHRDDGYRLARGVEPLTRYLQRAGYHTSNVLDAAPGVRGTRKTDFNFEAGEIFDGVDWTGRKKGQPFYAQVNFQETHRPFRRCSGNPVDPSRVEIPPCYPDHPSIRKDWAMYLETLQNLDEKIGRVLARLDQEGLARHTIVFFFSDHGRPMPRDKQFLYEGGLRIPLLVRIPESIRPPGYRPGSVRDDLVSAIDITATTLALAGVPLPPHLEGRPFFGPNVRRRDFLVAARDRCDETVDRIRCIRTRRYKYIRNFFPDRPYTQQNVYKDVNYPTLAVMRQLQQQGKLHGAAAAFLAPRRPPEELYDLEADPHETRNLAGDPAHRPTLERLRGMLDQWIRETGDQGQHPESGVMAWDQDRSEVQGWCTASGCRASQGAGVLRVICHGGKGARLERGFVAPPGPAVLEFRARSGGAAVTAFSWSLITDIRNPANRRPVDFIADGQWHDYRVPFEASDDLAILTLEFASRRGEIEFEWIRLVRGAEPLQVWKFDT